MLTIHQKKLYIATASFVGKIVLRRVKEYSSNVFLVKLSSSWEFTVLPSIIIVLSSLFHYQRAVFKDKFG